MQLILPLSVLSTSESDSTGVAREKVGVWFLRMNSRLSKRRYYVLVLSRVCEVST